MKVGYIRVSTVLQNESRQIDALKRYNIDKLFVEKCSAKDTDRKKLQEMLEFVREEDTIYVLDFSRLARSTTDLLDIIDTLENKKVPLISLKENLDTSTPTGRLLVTMIAAINEFERANLLERQREGIEIAKKEGKYKGRGKIEIPSIGKCYERYKNRKINKTNLAKELKISRPTLNKLFDEYLQNN